MKKLEDFLTRFVQPLVAGGDAHVGAPIDEARAAAWSEEIAAVGAAAEAIDQAREAIAAELCVRPPRLVFGAEELRLAMALYNALALAHPATSTWTARSGARPRVLAVSRALCSLPPPSGQAGLVARHTLLWQLPALSRQDTTVRWWTGKAEFRGQRPPRRLTAWPGLRNVRVDPARVPVHELLGFEEGILLHAALLDASPLTDVLHPDRAAPGFAWGHAGTVLADVELARLVAHAWIAPDRVTATLPAAAAAWERLLHGAAPAVEVRATTAFLVHVGVLAALDEGTPADPADAALALFWALPDVVEPVELALAAPPGIAAEARLDARWRARRARAVRTLGEDRIDSLRKSLEVRLG
jgi:hypothetical protein